MTGKATIAVIIPVYNEERTISSILEIVRSWGRASEIIVVNDGSTDKTLSAVRQFTNGVTILTQKQNYGKGHALALGIAAATAEILVFLDGDIVGIAYRDLDRMVESVARGKASMVIGVARFWTTKVQAVAIEPFNDLSGERVVLRKNLLPHLGRIRTSGYGVETLINDLHKGKHVVSVRLPHVYILGKFEKQTVPDAMRTYIKEAGEILGQAIRQQTGEVTPQVRRVYRLVEGYLKQALTYFQ